MAARFCVGTPLSSTAAWSATSGGASGATVPSAADDVHLDASSPSCTLDASMSCLTFDCTGYTNTLTHSAAVTLTVAGTAFTLVAGMTYTLGSATTSALSFTSTAGTCNLTAAGRTLGNVTFNGAGGTWSLVDGFTTGATGMVTLTAGTLNTNGQTCSWGMFASSNANTRTLTLGSTALTLTSAGNSTWNTATVTNFTITANTATISSASSSGNGGAATWMLSSGLNFNGASLVILAGTGSIGFGGSGTFTFANITITGAANATGIVSSSGPALLATGTLNITGNSAVNLLTFKSHTAGTSVTITCNGTVSANNLMIQDSKATGTAAPFFAGNNSHPISNVAGWTFLFAPIWPARQTRRLPPLLRARGRTAMPLASDRPIPIVVAPRRPGVPPTRGRPSRWTPGGPHERASPTRRPRARVAAAPRGTRTLPPSAHDRHAPTRARPPTRLVGPPSRSRIRWTPIVPAAIGPPPPCIKPPTSVRILPYASMGVITDYESAALLAPYTSTSTLVAYLASAIPKPYTAKAGIVAYTGKAAVVKYSSATTFGPTYCP